MSDTIDTQQCTNCKLDVPSGNFTIHSVHCQRNFYLCSKCQEPVNYSKKAVHDESYHVTVHCTNCHLSLEKFYLDDHLINDCPYRKVKCQFCDIEIKANDITEHENYCGSRTEKCTECGEFVMLKYKMLHVDSNHTFMKLSDEPGPSPSWQYGKRTLFNFLPDLSATPCKPASGHKRRSSENQRRFRNSDSKDDSDEAGKHNFFLSSPNEKGIEETQKVDSQFRTKEARKSSRRDSDDWPTLPSLRSLQISEERDNTPMRSKASSSSQDTVDDDLMYAIQVSQEINSYIWQKGSITETEDEALKNSFEPEIDQLPAEKEVKKNLFALSANPVGQHHEENLCGNDSAGFNSHDEQDVKLPCEFCGALIFSKDLILHQSRCSLFMTQSMARRSKPRELYLNEDFEGKIACGFCNKLFTLSLLEIHQLSCRRNSSKSWKNQDKGNYSKNMKAVNVKSEPGLQNGLEPSSPRLNRGGTRSQWLSELSKSNEGGRDMKKNLNHPESSGMAKTSKVSRKNRRAPSPPIK